MREIEKDGFITRDADLKSNGGSTAKPIAPCPYPKCDECGNYRGGYCTVPIVVTKQMMFEHEERVSRLEKTLADLEETLIYALYGIPLSEGEPRSEEQDENITWDEYFAEEDK